MVCDLPLTNHLLSLGSSKWEVSGSMLVQVLDLFFFSNQTNGEGEITPTTGVTWRIIPSSKWLITMVDESPK